MKQKKVVKNKKKANIFKRMGKGFKEIFSELKKVNWPKPGHALAQTGVVLAVVFAFLLVITSMDLGLTALLDLLLGAKG